MKLKGIHLPHRKHTDGMIAQRITTPDYVVMPVSMHIGAPATPVVKKGDSVYVGTLLAEQNGEVSSPVYSSVSGTVAAVEDILLSSGKTVLSIKVESDGSMTACPDIKPPVINGREDLIEAIKKSGIVGLGGAGFPTYVKFNTNPDQIIEELIINGAECEPYITSDSVTMANNSEDIAFAIEMLLKHLDIKKVIIGIESNKPAAIKSMKKIAEADQRITVKVLPSSYPQGGEKVLVYHTTGKKILLGKLPIDVGCVVSNSSTIAAIGKYLKTGMPLVEKCLTVDGGAVREPKNIIAPIGTPLESVFEFCGGFKEQPAKVVYGGPMMGVAVRDLDQPVLKTTNAVLALIESEAKSPKVTACINCGRCANHCPLGIDPRVIANALKNKDDQTMKKAGADLCMLCGCCSYVCPAKRPIVQNNRLAKEMLESIRTKEKK